MVTTQNNLWLETVVVGVAAAFSAVPLCTVTIVAFVQVAILHTFYFCYTAAKEVCITVSVPDALSAVDTSAGL